MSSVDLASLRGKYKLIYADPCWEYFGDPDKDQAAGKHYNQMSFEELVQLPVRSLIDDPGVIFMWVTGPKFAEGLDLLRAWGFHYRCVAYVWIKTTKDGRVIAGQGVRPSFVKQLDEFVIVGSTEPRGRTLPLLTESQGQNVFAPRPDDRHSAKPPEVRERIEELYGDIPRIELFARGTIQGWDTWGMEAEEMTPEMARSPKLKARLEQQAVERELWQLMENLPQD